MIKSKYVKIFPRLPLDGNLDITYRCNNNCRHCWLHLPVDASEANGELSFEEIRQIIDEARQMGCQAWAISGGEPMLRPDFSEIIDYIARNTISYKLNTNGTLITSQIAQSLAINGDIMVALYGATAQIHDFLTRNPGSFEATIRGFSYLKENHVPFTVQIVPMQANFHQLHDMQILAQKFSKKMRIGAAWLWLSANRSEIKNCEIIKQRIEPNDAITIDLPDPLSDLLLKLDNRKTNNCVDHQNKENDLFSECIESRRDFHIDPYGKMSFCYYIKDPNLRFDLRQGSFQQGWDEFIPSLKNQVLGTQEYRENCSSCEYRKDCRWCPAFAYLEHGRYSAKISYLCQLAQFSQNYKETWTMEHVKYYELADISIVVSADFPINNDTFAEKFKPFERSFPGDDFISIHLVSSVPQIENLKLGKEVYRKPPWAIYKQRDSWVYVVIASGISDDIHSLAIVNDDYSRITIGRQGEGIKMDNFHTLTTFPSDQIIFSQILSNRKALILHSSGMIINGIGFIFIGHSDVGKSTMMKMLKEYGEILCDDRIIIRRWPDGFRIHGTWFHGELSDISPASAPINALFFLEQANHNELIPINDKKELLGNIISHIVKGYVSKDWWEKNLDLAGSIATELPAYRLKFDKSGKVIDLIKKFCE